ncbi:hypothetical protein LJK87_34395 [Paenibacillus sp. P25]|nr:hypothetical protein LJK87_34395 [Paenibacillus sp. P25]
MILTLSGCARGDSLIIGAQTFSEPKILAQMYKSLIEDRTNVSVDVLCRIWQPARSCSMP